jgi:hypothetical protein
MENRYKASSDQAPPDGTAFDSAPKVLVAGNILIVLSIYLIISARAGSLIWKSFSDL